MYILCDPFEWVQLVPLQLAPLLLFHVLMLIQRKWRRRPSIAYPIILMIIYLSMLMPLYRGLYGTTASSSSASINRMRGITRKLQMSSSWLLIDFTICGEYQFACQNVHSLFVSPDQRKLLCYDWHARSDWGASLSRSLFIMLRQYVFL